MPKIMQPDLPDPGLREDRQEKTVIQVVRINDRALWRAEHPGQSGALGFLGFGGTTVPVRARPPIKNY